MKTTVHNRASMRENLSLGYANNTCPTSLRASIVGSAPLLLLFGQYHIQTCVKRNLTILACTCSLAGWFVCEIFGNPNDRFSRVQANIIDNVVRRSICSFQQYNTQTYLRSYREYPQAWDLQQVLSIYILNLSFWC